MEVKNGSIPQRLTLSARLKSFAYAIAGIIFMLKTQHNAWLHAVATMAVIALALYCNVSASDWRWLIVAMAMVWVGETINTAVEYVCDVVSPNYSEAVKHAKDIAAGGVLIAALASLIIGILTFWPYFT
ncbi:diacylglycerol kinase family protein [Massilia sp. PAMC28688]|uniref:diacylglycerol kinase family protein n=1 Tax=Massilia sp. PAMC28688 TaxID=2861283 RepID=UPI001C62B43B|nr:diacylglycerol kinase family protein [Massilia sp. PAMC28688]QYF93849.1 diacylglycerol kinase family protein [Massilia sp. PAMC28688]